MCLIAWAQSVISRYPLVLIANRDEFLERPTMPMHRWPVSDLGALQTSVLAGRDVRGGGTWMAIGQEHGLSAITNVREPRRRSLYPLPEPVPSRGGLTFDALRELADTRLELTLRAAQSGRYEGFNLLRTPWLDVSGAVRPAMQWLSNRVPGADDPAATMQTWLDVGNGVHGLSNAGLNTPWPKLCALKQALSDWISKSDQEVADQDQIIEHLLLMLADPTEAPDEQLPDTGVGLDKERMLSAIRIIAPHYATRSSTVVLLDCSGKLNIVERSHHVPLGVVSSLERESADRLDVRTAWTDRQFQLHLERPTR